MVHVCVARDANMVRERSRALLVVGAALVPDLDLLLRFVDGRNHHQQQTHSLGFAVAAAILVAALARGLGWARPMTLGLAAGAAWASHVLLDFMAVDTNPPIGVMALWPASSGYFHMLWPLFLDIGRTLEWSTVRHDAAAVAWEVCLLLPLLVVTWRLRTRARG
jgi:membrane-bound metal-dependent hydrolase YbcI (DUF457 family)